MNDASNSQKICRLRGEIEDSFNLTTHVRVSNVSGNFRQGQQLEDVVGILIYVRLDF